MKIQTLTVGFRVKHPQYGVGTVKAVSEHLAEIRFDDALRSLDPELSDLTPAEASMSITGLDLSLSQFVESIVEKWLSEWAWSCPARSSTNWARAGIKARS